VQKFVEVNSLDVPLQILDKKQYEGKSRDVWKKFADSLKPEILDTSTII
jgi:hypothetical protein